MKPAWWVECVSRSKGDAMHAADVAPTTQRVIGSKLRTTTWMVNGSAWVALEAARSRQWLGTQGPDLSAGSGLELLGAPWGSAGAELRHCQGGGYFDHALRHRLGAVAPGPSGVRAVNARDWRDVVVHGGGLASTRNRRSEVTPRRRRTQGAGGWRGGAPRKSPCSVERP